MFGNYIKSMPRLNDAEDRKNKSLKPGPTQVKPKYTRGSTSSGKPSNSTRCQKCEKFGHFTYNCPVTHAPYKARPSRTQQLLNPKPLREGPSVEVPEEFLTKKGIAEKILATNELERQEAQSKLLTSKSSKKKINPKHSSDSSSTSSSDSGSSSDSDSDSDSSSSSSLSTTSSSSSDSSDSSSDSDSSGSSRSGRPRVKRRPASPASSTKSSVAPRRYRHRSRSVSRQPVGSQTPPSPRPRNSPHRFHERPKSSRHPVPYRASPNRGQNLGRRSRSPGRIVSRSNAELDMREDSRDRDRRNHPRKLSPPPRLPRHRERSLSRESAKSRTPPSPRRGYSPHRSHPVRSPRHSIGSRARGSRAYSPSPRRAGDRNNSGYDERGSTRDRPRRVAEDDSPPRRRHRHRSKSVSREPAGSRTPPSPKRRHSPHLPHRRLRSPQALIDSRASPSPSRASRSSSRSRRKTRRPDPGYGDRASSRDHRPKIDAGYSLASPRRHRHRSRSASRDPDGPGTPPSPRRRHSPHRSQKRDRSRHSVESPASLSPRVGLRAHSRSPRRKTSRVDYQYDYKRSSRAHR